MDDTDTDTDNLQTPTKLADLGVAEVPLKRKKSAKAKKDSCEGPYEKLEKLGEGTYARVFKGQHRTNGRIVALKVMKIDLNEGTPSTSIREISVMKELQHPNILALIDILHSTNTLTLVFEYMDSDLGTYCKTHGFERRLDPLIIQSFMYQLLSGIEYCHAKQILHRDLKPQNLLVNLNGQLKIADFGLARSLTVPVGGYSSEVVTMFYRAPEVLLRSSMYDTAVDMWSVGCIMAEMFLGHALFRGNDPEDQLAKIFRVMGTPTQFLWPGLEKLPGYKPDFPRFSAQDLRVVIPGVDDVGLNLLNAMLQLCPSVRLPAQKALVHSWFFIKQQQQSISFVQMQDVHLSVPMEFN